MCGNLLQGDQAVLEKITAGFHLFLGSALVGLGPIPGSDGFDDQGLCTLSKVAMAIIETIRAFGRGVNNSYW